MQVSVVIPCYNVEQYIQHTLKAVFSQSGCEVEVICVDDGSTDGTVSAIQDFSSQEPNRIKLIEQANAGACAARNRGMVHSSASYIQFLDADDELDKDKLSHQLGLIVEGKYDLLVGDYHAVYEDGSQELVRSEEESDWLSLIKTRMGTTSANLWKRSAVDEAGGWAESLESSQDYDLIFRMLKNGASVGYDHDPHARVLKRTAGSISQTTKRENWLRYIHLRRQIRDFMLTTDSTMFSRELEVCDQYLFMAFRTLSQFDMEHAVRLYHEMIPAGFVPAVSKAISDRYVKLYNILGFSTTERLIRLLKPGLYRKS